MQNTELWRQNVSERLRTLQAARDYFEKIFLPDKDTITESETELVRWVSKIKPGNKTGNKMQFLTTEHSIHAGYSRSLERSHSRQSLVNQGLTKPHSLGLFCFCARQWQIDGRNCNFEPLVHTREGSPSIDVTPRAPSHQLRRSNAFPAHHMPATPPASKLMKQKQ